LKSVSDLSHKHYGQPAIILGGGMSLPTQVAYALARMGAQGKHAIRISCNQHGLVWGQCDYVVVVDRHVTADYFTFPDGSHRKLRDFGAPIIAPKGEADYRIEQQALPGSGIMGAWSAWVMGCAPIICCGMDFYQGGTYFHDPKAESTGTRRTVEDQLNRWARLPQMCRGDSFRSVDFPLAQLFPTIYSSDPAQPSTIDDVRAVLAAHRATV